MMDVFVLTQYIEPSLRGVYTSLLKAMTQSPRVVWETEYIKDDSDWSWLNGEDADGCDWTIYRFVLDAPYDAR